MARWQPQPRDDAEIAMLGNKAYLWGGLSRERSEFFRRDLICICNLASGAWEQRQASGDVPPPCYRARCEVIGDTVFTCGGKQEGGSRSMDMYRLNTTNLIWSKQVIDPTSEEPCGRSSSCLVALNPETLLLFGGYGPNPGTALQFGAQWLQEPDYQLGFNNELYLFNVNCGKWENVVVAGFRPKPRCASAMAPINHHKALLHGGYGFDGEFDDLFVVDIEKREFQLVFLSSGLRPPPKAWHTLSRFYVEEQPFFLLFGGKASATFDQCAYYYNFYSKRWIVAHFKNEEGKVISNCSIAHHSAACFGHRGNNQLDVFIVGGLPDGTCIYNNLKQNVSVLTVSLFPDVAIERIAELEDCEKEIATLRQQYMTVLTKETERIQKEHATALHAEIVTLRQQQETMLTEFQKGHATALHAEVVALRQLQETMLTEVQKEHATALHAEVEALGQQRETMLAEVEKRIPLSLEEMKKQLANFIQPLRLEQQSVLVNKEEKLGSGSFGAVYTGLFFDQPVAVKVIHYSSYNVATIEQEVLTLHRLCHPSIVTTYGFVNVTEDQSVPEIHIVTELLEGSLAELLKQKKPLEAYEEINIARDIVTAVTYLHTRQPKPYIHGDIRPTNILLTNVMKAKLGDLGAAHRLGSVSGDPLSKAYLAPERLLSPPQPSSLASDIYSFGVTLIELFLCKPPNVSLRQSQLIELSNRLKLAQFSICSRLIDDQKGSRPSAEFCFRQFLQLPHSSLQRKVQGKFLDGRHELAICQ